MASSATFEAKRFGRFLVAGGVAAAANYGSRFAYSAWLPFSMAVLLAYVTGMATAFVLMRRFVFDAQGRPAAPQALRFVAVNVLAFGLTLSISVLGVQMLQGHMPLEAAQAVAHGVGVAFPVVTSYVGHRFVTFGHGR